MLLSLTACASGGTDFLAGRQALIRGQPDQAIGYFDRIAQTEPTYVVTRPAPSKSIWTYVGRAHYNTGRYTEAFGAFNKALSHLADDYVARLYRGLTMLRMQSPAAPANAFSLQEITYALREGVSPRRVGALARERGLAFELSAESENQLRTAGADPALLDELRKLRAQRDKQSKSPDNQRTDGVKEVAAALTAVRDWLNFVIAYTPQGRYWDTEHEIRTEIERGLQLTAASQLDSNAILALGEWMGSRLEEENDRARVDEDRDRLRQGR